MVVKVELVHFGKRITTREIFKELGLKDLRPGTASELETYRKQQGIPRRARAYENDPMPSEVPRFAIVALGSLFRSCWGRIATSLKCNHYVSGYDWKRFDSRNFDPYRGLVGRYGVDWDSTVFSFENTWPSDFRFLAMPKSTPYPTKDHNEGDGWRPHFF